MLKFIDKIYFQNKSIQLTQDDLLILFVRNPALMIHSMPELTALFLRWSRLCLSWLNFLQNLLETFYAFKILLVF